MRFESLQSWCVFSPGIIRTIPPKAFFLIVSRDDFLRDMDGHGRRAEHTVLLIDIMMPFTAVAQEHRFLSPYLVQRLVTGELVILRAVSRLPRDMFLDDFQIIRMKFLDVIPDKADE